MGLANEWALRDQAIIWHGSTQMSSFLDNAPVIVERAEGHYLFDVEGNRLLDAISSLWVNTLGHRVPELDRALKDQLELVAHSTTLGNGNRVVIELAEALAEVVPVDRPHFLFASDGASAVEQAIKIAFQYWINQGCRKRTTYVAFDRAYHGGTVGGISLGGGFEVQLFNSLRFPVLRAPGFDDPDAIAAAAELIDQNSEILAAVVVEPLVQGAAGMRISPPSSFRLLAEACQRTGVLLICDEIATGFGRTGTLFASEQCDLQPDLLCLGKGITGGYLPMSVTVANQKVFDAFGGQDLGASTFYHSHTYGGNALAAAVALRHLKLMKEKDALTNVRARAEQLSEELKNLIKPLAAVKEVRQQGLMVGIELSPPVADLRWGRRVCAAAVRRGVLLRPLSDVIVVVPPLTITPTEIDQIVRVLKEAIEEVCSDEINRLG